MIDRLEPLFNTARRTTRRAVFPEGDDRRVIHAARYLLDESLARPTLLGPIEQIERLAAEEQVDLNGVELISPIQGDLFSDYVQSYADRRKVKEGVARRLVGKPLIFGGMMVAHGAADALVAGVSHATASVIQAGALTVGLRPNIETISSFFLMVFPGSSDADERVFIFSDCAVNAAPSADQLADIALSSYQSAFRLLDEEPRVALLSFSTLGSAAHAEVDRVIKALQIIRQKDSGMKVDGEFQLDAAIVPSVAERKVKRDSAVAGQANVLVFPDLNTGNVAYKMAQYMAGAKAFGPFLQGFAKPVCDLSRGASVEDIVASTVITLATMQ